MFARLTSLSIALIVVIGAVTSANADCTFVPVCCVNTVQSDVLSGSECFIPSAVDPCPSSSTELCCTGFNLEQATATDCTL